MEFLTPPPVRWLEPDGPIRASTSPCLTGSETDLTAGFCPYAIVTSSSAMRSIASWDPRARRRGAFTKLAGRPFPFWRAGVGGGSCSPAGAPAVA